MPKEIQEKLDEGIPSKLPPESEIREESVIDLSSTDLSTLTKQQKYEILLMNKELTIRKSRLSFWEFAKATNPKFFKESRTYLQKMCNDLQDLVEDKLINPITHLPYQNMTINIPPRHGKSFTATLFAQWLFGIDKAKQVITVSYSRDLSSRFSQNVRDGIAVDKGEALDITYSDIFPEVFIKHGDGAKQAWSLEGSPRLNYFATSFGSGITGMGCQVGIIDDPVKDSIEAFNETVLDEKLEWYNNTFLSRVEKGGKKIVIATRWSTKDLTGRLLDREPNEWYELKLPVCLDEEEKIMLCSELFDYEMYLKAKSVMSEEIFMANYQQVPMDVKGRLYTDLHTYSSNPIPLDSNGNPLFERIISYTDTADTGADNLVSIVAGQYKGQLWVLDVLYSKDPMEITEPLTAKLFIDNKVTVAKIESNNGGRGFARTVEKTLLETYNTRTPKIEWFHQSKNKKARILTSSTYIINNVFFPVDWHITYSRFYQDLMAFQKEGKNKHDDAPDALTGLVEMVTDKGKSWKAVPSLY